ncbi:MAG: thioredoxin domain-containing protein [Polyangiales bacterium]
MLRSKVAFALLLVLGGVTLGASCRRQNTTPDARPDGQRAAPTEAAGPAITEVQGLDLASLNATERETFWAVANDELSPCGDPHSLAACARDHLPCRSCMPAMRFLARRIEEGYARDQLSELIRARYASSAATRVSTEGGVSHGSQMAAVTIVEFSDYECPHCARAVPVIRQVERDFEGRVRIVHMNFPLTGHLHGMPAARAALAAGRQGKFWEMHYLLFENQHHLEPADIERYATQLGLDLARFRVDQASPEIEAQIQQTRREGERLDISGTPTIYINNRRYELNLEREPLRQWVQEELDGPTQ